MGKIVLFIATSLDGYIAGPNGEVDWLFNDADYGFADFYAGVELVVMGRKTFDTCLGFEEWPYPGKRCLVLTRGPARPFESSVTFAGEEGLGVVQRSRAASDGTIWLVGGGDTIRSFLEHDLIDELVISIHPVLLGAGIPLVEGLAHRTRFGLKSTQAYPSGLVQLTYEHAHGPDRPRPHRHG